MMVSDTQLPTFTPVHLDPGSKVTLSPLTFGFFVFPEADIKICDIWIHSVVFCCTKMFLKIIFISVKTNRSINMIIYNIHEQLSRRTGTTGLAPRLPNSGARVRLLTSQLLTRWCHQGRHRIIVLLLIYLPRKDERLSWPSWRTCSGRITHIVVTRRLQAEHRTGSVRQPKIGVLPTVLCNQCIFLLRVHLQCMSIRDAQIIDIGRLSAVLPIIGIGQ